MTEEILDQDLEEDVVRLSRYEHYKKWAKRWSWVSVIILFAFVFLSGVLIPVFDDRSNSLIQFLQLTGSMIIVFLVLLTISNLCSLYFRWRGFSMLVHRSERDYFNLIISLIFLLAPFLLILLFFGVPLK